MAWWESVEVEPKPLGEPGSRTDRGVHQDIIGQGAVVQWDLLTRITAQTKRVRARRVQHQNGECAELQSSRVCRLSTTCGRPEVYIRGRSQRCTGGSPGDLDSLPLWARADSLGRCRPHRA